jgi:nucleosome assembly protein 1-like 1
MSRPPTDAMAAVSINGGPAGGLSPEAMTSVEVLRVLQATHDGEFDQYLRERRALEDKYAARFHPLYISRSEELDKGALPQFWLTAFEHCEDLRDNITDKDATALRYLRDVTCTEVTAADAEAAVDKANANERKDGEMPVTMGSFTLHFKFDENPFFENKVLTKTYVMDAEDDEELDQAVGCEIKWKPGKDLTVRIMKKKIRGGRGGAGKVLTKKEPCDSFFHFFSPPKTPADGQEIDEEELEVLEEVVGADFEMGDTIRQELITKAVLYFEDKVENESVEEDNEEEGVHEDASEDDDDENEDDTDDDEGIDERDGDDSSNGDDPPPLPPAAQNVQECKQQ